MTLCRLPQIKNLRIHFAKFVIFVTYMWHASSLTNALRSAFTTALLLLCFAGASAFSIIIDAGHGGKDYGAIGAKTNEKSINLAVALLIAEHLEKNYPDVDVLLTRDDDTYLTLKERADFANKNGGDLFVSVHVNSVDKRNRNRANIQGASVYTLGLHKSSANFEVAKRENSVISLENDYSANYEGFDPESSESYIIFEMSQNKHMGQSISLAQHIQNALTGKAARADRGVRQAGFWVLWATGMPSVLIELDFICNPVQEKYLASKKGQTELANAIGSAIGTYIESHAAIEKPEIYLSLDDLDEEEVIEIAEPKSSTTYHVQILASSKPIPNGSRELKGYKAAFYREGKWHKYYIGEFSSATRAQKLLKEVKKQFPEAFVIALRDGKRVTK